jgi:hypothetical protein
MPADGVGRLRRTATQRCPSHCNAALSESPRWREPQVSSPSRCSKEPALRAGRVSGHVLHWFRAELLSCSCAKGGAPEPSGRAAAAQAVLCQAEATSCRGSGAAGKPMRALRLCSLCSLWGPCAWVACEGPAAVHHMLLRVTSKLYLGHSRFSVIQLELSQGLRGP